MLEIGIDEMYSLVAQIMETVSEFAYASDNNIQKEAIYGKARTDLVTITQEFFEVYVLYTDTCGCDSCYRMLGT